MEYDRNDPLWNENDDDDVYLESSDDDDEEEEVVKKKKTKCYFNYFNFIIAAVRFGLSSYCTTVLIWAMLMDQGITDKSMYPSEFRVRSLMKKYGNLLQERLVQYKCTLFPKYLLTLHNLIKQ